MSAQAFRQFLQMRLHWTGTSHEHLCPNAKFLKFALRKETGGQVASWHSSQAVLVPATNFEINIQAPAI